MEIKKTPKADLQNKKILFFEVGLAVALLFMLLAFNWKSNEKTAPTLVAANTQKIEEEEQVPITENTPPPPQEIPLVPVVSDQIVIVEDNIELNTNVDFSGEDSKKLGVAEMAYVEKKVTKKEETVVEEAIPFAIVEEKPSFQGGDANTFTKWVMSKVVYPAAAQENNIQGTVYLSFEVGTSGQLGNVKILRGVDPLLDQEAIRVVKLSPAWKPGRQQNKAVKVAYQFPVKFQLQ